MRFCLQERHFKQWSHKPTIDTISSRLARPKTMAAYGKFVAALETDGLDAAHAEDGVVEVGHEALTTRLMLALRTREGVSEAELTEAFGGDLARAAAEACREATEELPAEWMSSSSEQGRFALSDPEGLLFSNEVISSVFARLDDKLK